MEKDEFKKKIEQLEDCRINYYLVNVKKIGEALNSGRSSESVFVDFSRMKERYLEAICTYGQLGLLSRELYEKRGIWLWRPGEGDVPSARLKTVSMYLNRLSRAGLVYRKREGREYRYFITMNGRKRLYYYQNLSMRKKDAFFGRLV